MDFVSPDFSISLKPSCTNSSQNIAWTDNPLVFESISGAIYIPNFLTEKEHNKCISIFDSHEYQHIIRRRQQFYGPVYYHTTHDLKEIQPISDKKTEENVVNEKSLNLNELQFIIDKLLDKKECADNEIFNTQNVNECPDQALVNEYIDNTGISTHFDDFNAFGSVIATISFLNPVFMTLQKPTEINNHCTSLVGGRENGCVRILLEPRSLFVLKDDARYKWRHGITRHKLVFLPKDRGVLKRHKGYRRISLTVRKLGKERKRIKENDLRWVDPEHRRPIPITGNIGNKSNYNSHENNLEIYSKLETIKK